MCISQGYRYANQRLRKFLSTRQRNFDGQNRLVCGLNYVDDSLSGVAGRITTDSPQPQASVWLGLRKRKREASRSRAKSISVPIRNITALGSISIRTPLSSITSSNGFCASA